MKITNIFLLAGVVGAACAGEVPLNLDSGKHSNGTPGPRIAYANAASVPNLDVHVRVHFSDYHLGPGSFLRLQSVEDGNEQRLDSAAMANWDNTSAVFNGSTVIIELHVAPGDRDAFFVADKMITSCANCSVKDPGWKAPPPGAESLCGPDDRVASTDNRVGRIGGCTAWLISNGAVLTAGHCGAPVAGVFEVNIPASNNGNTVASAPNDQFPIIAAGQQSQNLGQGRDWAVFSIGPNAIGQVAHVQFGFFRVTRFRPASGQIVRITGCGIDNQPAGAGAVCCNTDGGGNCTHPNCNNQSQTLQTSLGFHTGENIDANAAQINYAVDTEPANSGSPVIWEAGLGFAFGIHSHGGCGPGGGANGGISFEHDPLENAMNNFFGANTAHLDWLFGPGFPAPTGSILSPFLDLRTAHNNVPVGGTVRVVTGNYNGGGNRGTFNRAMTIVAPVGAATFGN